ncbi:MAG: sulfatase-like hydrolase/transferase [Anaerolineae bacterium]|nr:sulfatase-like hydrolase/transferase [Anaerolineae bacterium]
MPTQKPNVIFITTDQQRYDTIAANGYPHMITPTLDRMIADGVNVENCFVQNPVCMASRSSIWTGRYPQNHGVTTNGIQLPKTEVTMAHTFLQNGYHTANIGKLHFVPHKGEGRDHSINATVYSGYGYEYNLVSEAPGPYPDDYMSWVEREAPQYIDGVRYRLAQSVGPESLFDLWDFQAPEEIHNTAWVATQTREFLLNYRDPRPFFLTVGFFYPHPPLNPPRSYVDMYDPATIPMPTQHPSDMARSRNAGVSDETWRQMRRYYYALVTQIDRHLATILETLQAAGLADNTIVVFLSDHGEMLGDHCETSKGPSNYDEILHVPCIFYAPWLLPSKRKVSGLVEAIDVFPTVADLCGVRLERGVKGRSIAAALKGETDETRPDVLAEYKDTRNGIHVKTLRDERYKYFYYGDGREVLYDLADADQEVIDHAAEPEYEPTIQALRKRLLTRLMQAQDDLPPKTHDW